jgi:hypothetical protein
MKSAISLTWTIAWTIVVAGGLLAAAASSAGAASITASCATIAGVTNSEADYLYYEAEAEIGAGPAGRLYGVYHQLKNKCQLNPHARIVVTVQPRVKEFFEARR